jgi:hypothetical protein
MTIHDPGPRICKLGPSNSGKSTLAAAIGRDRGLTPGTERTAHVGKQEIDRIQRQRNPGVFVGLGRRRWPASLIDTGSGHSFCS